MELWFRYSGDKSVFVWIFCVSLNQWGGFNIGVVSRHPDQIQLYWLLTPVSLFDLNQIQLYGQRRQSCLVTIEWAARAQSSRKCGHLLPHNGIVSQERQSKVTVRNQDNVSGHLSNFIRISMNTKIKSDNRQVLESNWIMYHPYSALWINLDLLNSVHLTSAMIKPCFIAMKDPIPSAAKAEL